MGAFTCWKITVILIESKKVQASDVENSLFASSREEQDAAITNQLRVVAFISGIFVSYFSRCLVTFQFQGLPYINPMSLSDPSLAPLGTATGTPQQQAQAQEMLMNSSMMYLHEVSGVFKETHRSLKLLMNDT